MNYLLFTLLGCSPPEPNRESIEELSKMYIKYFTHDRKVLELYPTIEMLDSMCERIDENKEPFHRLKARIKSKQKYASELPEVGITRTNFVVEYTKVTIPDAEDKIKNYTVGQEQGGCKLTTKFQLQSSYLEFKTYGAQTPDQAQEHQEEVVWMNIDNLWYLFRGFNYIYHDSSKFKRKR